MESVEQGREELLNEYEKHFSKAGLARLRALGHDIIPVKKEGARVFDAEGRRYIDCITSCGIYNLGRRPPAVIDAFKKAMVSADQGNFPLISSEKARLAEALANFTPGALECSVFSVSRGETFEFACKLSRGFTKRQELIAVDGSWFGQTGFALALSERKDKKDFGPLIPKTRIIEFGDEKAALDAVTAETAAVFLEPVQAENHCREAGREYLEALGSICRDAGALLVFDETQTNMGRTGEKFAFEHHGVEPDILILGEALAAGVFPIAATIHTQKLNAFMNANPLIHLSTFGGSDLGCVVACKALEVYEETRPWENARRIGEMLIQGLTGIAEAAPLIESIAGKGLLLSIELSDPEAAEAFCKALSRAGVLARPGDVAAHSVVLRPSLAITGEEADIILDAVEAAAMKPLNEAR